MSAYMHYIRSNHAIGPSLLLDRTDVFLCPFGTCFLCSLSLYVFFLSCNLAVKKQHP